MKRSKKENGRAWQPRDNHAGKERYANERIAPRAYTLYTTEGNQFLIQLRQSKWFCPFPAFNFSFFFLVHCLLIHRSTVKKSIRKVYKGVHQRTNTAVPLTSLSLVEIACLYKLVSKTQHACAPAAIPQNKAVSGHPLLITEDTDPIRISMQVTEFPITFLAVSRTCSWKKCIQYIPLMMPNTMHDAKLLLRHPLTFRHHKRRQ